MSTIRAFVAIDLTEAVRKELAWIINDLKRNVPAKSVRWVRPENIHLTLKFLGDTKIDSLDHISSGLDRVGEGKPPLNLTLDTLGCFPNPRRPRVVWVGISGDVDTLQSLQKMIDQMLNSLGWDLEKREFHPHLTIGRIKNSKKVVDSRLPWGSPMKPLTFPVDSLALYESILKPSGAVYTVRHVSQLLG
ncbi:MAG: RNA 2',3'-cyclic phosphodiesterase [Chloroflexota bacterium]